MMTSRSPPIISSAMAWKSLRSSLCAAQAAGVAWLNGTLETTPADLPLSMACSEVFCTVAPSEVTPIMPFSVLEPVAMAVPAAAESV